MAHAAACTRQGQTLDCKRWTSGTDYRPRSGSWDCTPRAKSDIYDCLVCKLKFVPTTTTTTTTVAVSYHAQTLLAAECTHGGPVIEHSTKRRRRRCRRRRFFGPCQPTTSQSDCRCRHISSLSDTWRSKASH